MEKQIDIIAEQICSKFEFVESITDEGDPEYGVYENDEGMIIGRDQNCLFTELHVEHSTSILDELKNMFESYDMTINNNCHNWKKENILINFSSDDETLRIYEYRFMR